MTATPTSVALSTQRAALAIVNLVRERNKLPALGSLDELDPGARREYVEMADLAIQTAKPTPSAEDKYVPDERVTLDMRWNGEEQRYDHLVLYHAPRARSLRVLVSYHGDADPTSELSKDASDAAHFYRHGFVAGLEEKVVR